MTTENKTSKTTETAIAVNGGGMKSKPTQRTLIQRTELTEALFYTAC